MVGDKYIAGSSVLHPRATRGTTSDLLLYEQQKVRVGGSAVWRRCPDALSCGDDMAMWKVHIMLLLRQLGSGWMTACMHAR